MSTELSQWLEKEVKRLAEMKKAPKRFFVFDLPVRPRYSYWKSPKQYENGIPR